MASRKAHSIEQTSCMPQVITSICFFSWFNF